ncbi:MAG: DnaJ C-terminal domain-containing protein [Gemmatimonadota bacterium]
MAGARDFYAVLGVSPTATADEIKKQYRKLAKQHHPDANTGDAKAAERFKEISEAYGVVGDAEKRKQYDEMRRLGAFTSRSAGAGARRPGGGAAAGGAAGGFRGEPVDLGGGFGSISDLWSSLFGDRNGARGRAAEAGQTVETTLKVPFRTAATGGRVEVKLDVVEECGTCKGTGAAAGARLNLCPECDGRGEVSFGQGGCAVNRPCPLCVGRGQIPSQKCGPCSGAGELRNARTVAITVPAGADSGARVRLKGQGARGRGGGPPGDLVITFQVEPDRFFQREGLDLVAAVPINVAQAVLGTTISVKALDGSKLAVKIPAGTGSGKRFRVAGQGIAKGAERGDLFVETQVTVPESLTPEQEKLMQQFAAAGGLRY